MKVCGIIAEYNPFHKGHEYQLQYAREVLHADYIVAAMSGDFVQRGTPALFEKRIRAQMALSAGADLVLEMPVRVSSSSAEGFAEGGVKLLDSLGVVDILCFGSESGDTTALMSLAGILAEEPEEYRLLLRRELQQGRSFPAAREAALREYLLKSAETTDPDKKFAASESKELSALLSSPNNLLGIEYCKAILREKSSMLPAALKREGADYHSQNLTPGELPSASYLRSLITSAQIAKEAEISAPEAVSDLLEKLVPAASLPAYMEAILKHRILTEEDLDLLLRCQLLRETKESLLSCLDMSEALADRIMKHRSLCEGFSSFTQLLKTREVTQTRIQRALLHLLLDIKKECPDSMAPYARILGFRREAAPLLKSIRANASVPLLQKAGDFRLLSPEALRMAQEDLYASNLYETLLSAKTKQAFRHEYEKPVVIL